MAWKCCSIRLIMKTLYHAFTRFTDAVKPTGLNELKFLGQTLSEFDRSRCAKSWVLAKSDHVTFGSN